MKIPDFKAIANDYACVVRDVGPNITDTYQVCVKQDWTGDRPDVEWYRDEESAEDLANVFHRSIETALRTGWESAMEVVAARAIEFKDECHSAITLTWSVKELGDG